MKNKVRFLGLDVHAETIAVAIAEPDGEVRSLGTIANRAESIRKLIKKLGPVEQLKACYEAGPTGYVLYWQLAELGVACEVIAPTLVPMKAGDRVKTDRRDAERLARSYRSGDLTAVWVPDEGSGVVARSGAGARGGQARSVAGAAPSEQVSAALGQRPAAGMKAWTAPYMAWVRQVHFAQVAREATMLDYLHEVDHMGERVKRLEQAITEAVKLASPASAGSGQGLAGFTRHCGDFGGDDCGGVRQHHSLRHGKAVDGLQRRGSYGRLQRPANPAREHYQNRQRASATDHC
jgi:transposase